MEKNLVKMGRCDKSSADVSLVRHSACEFLETDKASHQIPGKPNLPLNADRAASWNDAVLACVYAVLPKRW